MVIRPDSQDGPSNFGMISVEEYNQAVKEYTRSIFRFLYKSLKDEDAANDIVQDCYLKLWQNRDKINPQKIKSWLFSVAHHAMLNYLNATSRKVKLDENCQTPPVFQNNEFDTKAVLERALSELSPLQKSILLLRDLEGHDYKEIGEILELNEAQVKVYLFRARQKVKNYIKELTNVL
jgi:RNA polymerase sigma factor (sigma-70 family)